MCVFFFSRDTHELLMEYICVYVVIFDRARDGVLVTVMY